jgi:hypothetical protein
LLTGHSTGNVLNACTSGLGNLTSNTATNTTAKEATSSTDASTKQLTASTTSGFQATSNTTSKLGTNKTTTDFTASPSNVTLHQATSGISSRKTKTGHQLTLRTPNGIHCTSASAT